MANKVKKELKDLSVQELGTKVAGLQKELFQSRMKQVSGQLTNSSSLWQMRKSIARAKTFISQKAAQK